MKVVRNTFLNRIFKNKQVKDAQKELQRLITLRDSIDHFRKEVEALRHEAIVQGTALNKLFNLHMCMRAAHIRDTAEYVVRDEAAGKSGVFIEMAGHTDTIAFWEQHQFEQYGPNSYTIDPTLTFGQIIGQLYQGYLSYVLSRRAMEVNTAIQTLTHMGYAA